jgi:hypothetical protein
MRGTSNTAIQAPKSDVIGPLPPDFDELERPDRALCGSPVALGAITGKIAGRPAALAFLSREPAFVPARAYWSRNSARVRTSPSSRARAYCSENCAPAASARLFSMVRTACGRKPVPIAARFHGVAIAIEFARDV